MEIKITDERIGVIKLIKTKEWLIEARTNAGLSQQQLADKCGLSVPTVAKIEQGQRIGSASTWEKLNKVLSNVDMSYECSSLIDEIKEEILLYGCDYKCYLYYELRDGIVLFVDYALDRDLDDSNFEPLSEEKMMESTLNQALEIFAYQNKIIK